MQDSPPTIGLLTEGTSFRSLKLTLGEEFPGYEIESLSAKDLQDRPLIESFRMVVCAGIPGLKSPYPEYFNQRAMGALFGAVREKGVVLVTECASSWPFGDRYSFKTPHRSKHNHRGLAVFKGKMRGPLKYSAPHPLHSHGSDHVVRVRFKNAAGKKIVTGVGYCNGPLLYLSKNDKGTNVIATYEDVPDHPVAVASKTFGKGLIVWMGVLPASAARHIPSIGSKGNPRLSNFVQYMTELTKQEPGRKKLMGVITNTIKTHLSSLRR